MSNLQLGLITIGILLILGVVAFNWWQSKQISDSMRGTFSPPDQDPLLQDEVPPVLQQKKSTEPSFSAFGAKDPSLTEPGFAVEDQDPTLDTDKPIQADIFEAPAQTELVHDNEYVDEFCETVIDIPFAAPVSGNRLIDFVKSIRHIGTKPVRFFAETQEGAHRASIHASEQYLSMQMAVVLANRSGPLTEIELSKAISRADEIAAACDGSVEAPPNLIQELKRAERLDQSCAQLDAQVGVTLKLEGPQPVSVVRKIAHGVGFSDYHGTMAWVSGAEGIPRFILFFDGQKISEVQSASVERVELLLDVPQTPADDHAFERMFSVAQQLAEALQAQILDDSGRPLSERAVADIDKSLSVLYNDLTRANIVPGSQRAFRLFS